MSCLLRSAEPNNEGVVQIHLGIVAMRAEFFHQTEQWYKIMQLNTNTPLSLARFCLDIGDGGTVI